jgi:hypothetical protein
MLSGAATVAPIFRALCRSFVGRTNLPGAVRRAFLQSAGLAAQWCLLSSGVNGSRGSSWPWARLQAGQGAPAPPQSQYPQPALHSVRAAPGGLIVCGRECFLRDGLAQSAYA